MRVRSYKTGGVKSSNLALDVHNLSYALLILLILSHLASADEYRSKINEGYDLYKNGEYDKAMQSFKDAGILRPDHALPSYDQGTALYKSNDFQGAADAFATSVSKNDPRLKADSYYNAGNSYVKAQQYDKAIQSYIDALKINARDQDYKHNLEMALLQKQMQQQQQKQDQNQKQNKDQNQQQQQKQDQQKEQEKKQDEQQQQQAQNKEDKKEQQQQPQQGQQRKQQMNKEQAEQLLARFEDDEKDTQKLLKQVMMKGRSLNDW